MNNLEKLVDVHSELCIVRERYGNGFACYLSGKIEAMELIADNITGGDSDWEGTLYLEASWYPYVTADTIAEAMQLLENKIEEQLKGVTLLEYALATDIGACKMINDKGTHHVHNWPTDVKEFLSQWRSDDDR